MSTNYDNIDFLLQTLYDFAYATTDKCTELKYGLKKNITLEILKKDPKFDYSHIFKTDIVFDSLNHNKLVFKRGTDTSYPSMLRICKYKKDDKLTNMANKQVIDMKLNYILSEVAINDPYKFILFPIMNFDVKLNDLDKKIGNDIKKHYKNIDNNDMLCVQVFEYYYKMETLKEYLDKHHKDFSIVHWRVLAFQILYMLYKIQQMYPYFRHNMLDLETLYVFDNQSGKDDISILVNDIEFVVPNLDFNLKLTNFYKSYIPVYAENIHTKLKSDNQYYDVHYVFSSLLKYMDDNNIKDSRFKSFLNDIVPPNYISNTIGLDEEYYAQHTNSILNPFNIITKNIFFTEFIKDNMSRINKRPSLKNSSVDLSYTSSLTDSNTDGFAPSRLGRERTNNNTIVGSRKMNKNAPNSNLKYFNDFGELTETEPKQRNKKLNKKIYDFGDDDNIVKKLLVKDDKDNDNETSAAKSFDSDLNDKEEDKTSSSSSSSTSSSTTTSDEKEDDGSSSLPDIQEVKRMTKNTNQKNNGLFRVVENYAAKNQKQQPPMVKQQDNAILRKKSKGKKGKKHSKHNEQDAHKMPKILENALPANYKGIVPHELLSHLPNLGEQQQPNMGMGMGMGQPMDMGQPLGNPLGMGMPNMNIPDMGNQMSMDNALMGNTQQFSNLMANQQNDPLMGNFMGNQQQEQAFMGNQMQMQQQQQPMETNHANLLPNNMLTNDQNMFNMGMQQQPQQSGGKRNTKKKNKQNDSNDFFFLRGANQK